MDQYYVYILTNKPNGTLYIGMTNDLERRVREHKDKRVPGFSNKYDLHKLVYYEEYSTSQEAYIRELQMKKWKRQWKINLIEKCNPYWADLAKEWYE